MNKKIKFIDYKDDAVYLFLQSELNNNQDDYAYTKQLYKMLSERISVINRHNDQFFIINGYDTKTKTFIK